MQFPNSTLRDQEGHSRYHGSQTQTEDSRLDCKHVGTQAEVFGSDNDGNALADFHLSLGWWLLLLFVVMGVFLESLHGFKVAWYLNVGQESRRLLWRLAHAHGTFLALINVGFAATIFIRKNHKSRRILFASRCLLAASLLVPGGFFLGGTTFYANDPGVGIILLPIGALLLILALLLVATAKRAC